MASWASQGPGSPRTSLPPTAEEAPEKSDESNRRTVSSGVLGIASIEVDPDTESDSDDSSSISSFQQLARSVSTVRRGQAQIIRNPSARRSVVPEVSALQYRVER
jgi:uncharacterized membrane-anchored protein